MFKYINILAIYFFLSIVLHGLIHKHKKISDDALIYGLDLLFFLSFIILIAIYENYGKYFINIKLRFDLQ